MLIAVFVEEVVNKINPALLDVAMLISLDADTLQALNIPFPMREIRLLCIGERRLSRSMVIRNLATEGNFDTLDSIHHQETQLAVKEVVRPHFIQRCAGNIVVRYLSV